MTSIAIGFLVTLPTIIFARLFWANEKAYEQRQRILLVCRVASFVRQNVDLYDDFELVSFRRHVYALALFQDPLCLYPQRLRDEFERRAFK